VNSVTLSPATASGILNETIVCLTAHVEDDFFNPVAGVLVNFYITGINAITGTAYTNANGDAEYCYTQTGTASGVDEVYAEIFGFTSTVSTVHWTYIPTCTDPTDGGVIGSDQSGCGPYNPSELLSILAPSGETGTLEYKWQQSVIDNTTGFSDIPASNSASFLPGMVSQTTWFRRLARVDCMPDWTGAALSNVLALTVVPELSVTISISASSNPYCSGSAVSFSSISENQGQTPTYQWIVNGIPVGTGSGQFTFAPSPGDAVYCILTSSETCTVTNPASSNTINMIPDMSLPASVVALANPNPVCQGSVVQLTALPANGGSVPVFEWTVNGTPAGAGNAFSYTPEPGDLVQCIMTSSMACVSGNPAYSNFITISTLPLPVVDFTPCFDMSTMVNARPFQLKGGTPAGGIYSGPGVNSTTGMFDPGIAGTGIQTIYYSYTGSNSCSSQKSLDINVHSEPFFTCGNTLTDIRDSRQYSTAQIGSQCWMKVNLEFGSPISEYIFATDNCISEKYTHTPTGGNQVFTYYTWDELMGYEVNPGGQGFCPPGWHVPGESDWATLFNHYLGPGRAGKPLQDLILDKVNALPGGVFYLNTNWSFIEFATFFWSSVPSGETKAVAHAMNLVNYSVATYHSSRANAFPVRCVKD
jgi:uncharacterized protein (TIGR02145 family)